MRVVKTLLRFIRHEEYYMIARTLLYALTLVAAFAASAAEEIKLDTNVQKFSYGLGLQIGNRLAQQGVRRLDGAALGAAINDMIAGRQPRLGLPALKASRIAYVAEMKAARKALAKTNLKAEQDFLKGNRGKEGVIELPSGVQYRVLEAGKGDAPGKDDLFTVNYRGRLPDGTEFDSSYKHGKPVELNVAKVIPGWREILPLMKAGSKWRVWIPSRLAYAERGAGARIGPNQLLEFDVDLLSFKAAAKSAAPKTTGTTTTQ